jgi:hypothetical protein
MTSHSNYKKSAILSGGITSKISVPLIYPRNASKVDFFGMSKAK